MTYKELKDLMERSGVRDEDNVTVSSYSNEIFVTKGLDPASATKIVANLRSTL